jgi:hypothetical protein
MILGYKKRSDLVPWIYRKSLECREETLDLEAISKKM